jgi:hypothetical protein
MVQDNAKGFEEISFTRILNEKIFRIINFCVFLLNNADFFKGFHEV